MDLRDPKLSIMPDGHLMLNMGGSVYQPRCRSSSPRIFSGSITTRSLPPLPSRTMIWPRAKSTSLTRSRSSSRKRRPVP